MLVVESVTAGRVQIGGHRRQPIGAKDTLSNFLVLFKKDRQTLLFTLSLDLSELLLAGLADLENLFLRGSFASDGQETHDIGLVDVALARVLATVITLPVRVLSDVTGRKRDAVIVGKRIVCAGRRIAI